MIPVYQTMFAGGDDSDPNVGNCMQAAFASLLELDLDDVPHFIIEGNELGSFGESPGWWRSIERFIVDHGFCMVTTSIPLPSYGIMSGTSPRGNWLHCVVSEGPDMVHDPHPDGTGVIDPDEWWYLIPIDPALHKAVGGQMSTAAEFMTSMNRALDHWNKLRPNHQVSDRLAQ